MKTIIFGDSSQVIRLEFPPQWTRPTGQKVNLSIHAEDGTELLASTAATLIGLTELTSATVQGDTSASVSTGYTFIRGDRVWFTGGADGPGEEAIVKYVDGTTVHFEEELDYGHENGTFLYGLFATYTLDASSATDYPLGRRVVTSWDPLETNWGTLKDLYEVTNFVFDLASFKLLFEEVYPTEFQIANERFESLYGAMRTKVFMRLRKESINLNRAVETSIFEDTFLEGLCWYINAGTGGNAREYEADAAKERYDTAYSDLLGNPIWFDDDQDGEKDDDETKLIPQGPRMRGWAH